MGMDEFSGQPLATLAAHFEALQGPLTPRGIFAQLNDHFVVLIEQGDPAV